MDTIKRRGRPPKPPQSQPLFLGVEPTRVDRVVRISRKVSAELDRYLAWASERAAMRKDEAQCRFLESVIADFIKRDQLYQRETAQQAASSGDTAVVTGS